ASLPEQPDFKPTLVNKPLGPWVFLGYKSLVRKSNNLTIPPYTSVAKVIDGNEVLVNQDNHSTQIDFSEQDIALRTDSTQISAQEFELTDSLPALQEPLYIMSADVTPKWLRDALTSFRIQEDFMYSTMVNDPSTIDYSYWDLPVPPRLLEDDVTFAGYIRRLQLPSIDLDKAIIPDEDLRKKHWLHNFGASLHFSQAYVSSNWYQGGNNHLSLLFNFNWNVQLNQVYHPNLLFQSNLQYKLGLYSTPQDEVHRYSISEDLLQYNLNTGVKAFKKWFYSLNALFKTQILKNYEKNSNVRTASFLSPGDLNVGLGMSYSHQNKLKTLQLTATISPLSYNLKTCITDKIDHTLYNIEPSRKSRSEFGSNGEFNMLWAITPNITYKTRVFIFTDYTYFLSDWENTINFEINRFLSTQIFAHLRFDSSTDLDPKWKHFQLREILSFGLSYTFSTKP
ncbi:MAG: DUF3078 domain-containing protein, partial [Muribaculaceae bacterium]|nr:DUF3078 domain-containing protein [Muribaculaceae bacterium]